MPPFGHSTLFFSLLVDRCMSLVNLQIILFVVTDGLIQKKVELKLISLFFRYQNRILGDWLYYGPAVNLLLLCLK